MGFAHPCLELPSGAPRVSLVLVSLSLRCSSLPSSPAWQAMHRPLLGHCGGSRAERVRIDLSVGPLLCAIWTFDPDFWTIFLTLRETSSEMYGSLRIPSLWSFFFRCCFLLLSTSQLYEWDSHSSQAFPLCLGRFLLMCWRSGELCSKCHLQTGLCHLCRELHQRDKETSTRETLGAPEGSSKQG